MYIEMIECICFPVTSLATLLLLKEWMLPKKETKEIVGVMGR